MTQEYEVLKHMKDHGSITPLEALNHYGCFRLAARIHRLREQGHDIQTDIITHGDKQFAQYRLK